MSVICEKSMFYICVSIIIILISSIFGIVLNDKLEHKSPKNSPQETYHQNIAEIIWMWISMILITILFIVLICIHFLVLNLNFNDLLIIFSSFSLINISILFDFFSRNEIEIDKNMFALIFLFVILLFLKSTESYQ